MRRLVRIILLSVIGLYSFLLLSLWAFSKVKDMHIEVPISTDECNDLKVLLDKFWIEAQSGKPDSIAIEKYGSLTSCYYLATIFYTTSDSIRGTASMSLDETGKAYFFNMSTDTTFLSKPLKRVQQPPEDYLCTKSLELSKYSVPVILKLNEIFEYGTGKRYCFRVPCTEPSNQVALSRLFSILTFGLSGRYQIPEGTNPHFSFVYDKNGHLTALFGGY